MILSKKEIKETLNPSVLFAIQRKVCLYARVAVEELLKYTEKLETREQKLIEKLEEDNKRNKETVTYYEQARRDCKDKSEYKKIYQNNINTLNAKREVRKEILEILKGENDE